MATSLLRFLTCGSVDDGKSTLIGRLLHDCRRAAGGQAGRARPISPCSPTGSRPSASRASRSTSPISISSAASAASSSPTRRATSNIRATWRPAPRAPSSPSSWSTPRKGVLTQTRRHATIARLLGIRSFVLAVNKMDLVGFDQAPVRRRSSPTSPPSRSESEIDGFTAIPVSALEGDNITAPSARMPWYDGPALLPFLESGRARRAARRVAGLPHAGPAGDPRRRRAFLCGHDRRGQRPARRRGQRSRPAGTRANVARGSSTMDGDLDQARGGPVGRAQLHRRRWIARAAT